MVFKIRFPVAGRTQTSPVLQKNEGTFRARAEDPTRTFIDKTTEAFLLPARIN